MLSTVSVTSVTSGIILSAAQSRLTSFIVMTIFNNGLKFRIVEEYKFRAIISTAINVSRDYKPPWRETVQGPFLDKFF